MKRALLLSLLLGSCVPTYAQDHSDCRSGFEKSQHMSELQYVKMAKKDLIDLAQTPKEIDLINKINYYELARTNVSLYCGDLGKSNKIIYFLVGELAEYMRGIEN